MKWPEPYTCPTTFFWRCQIKSEILSIFKSLIIKTNPQNEYFSIYVQYPSYFKAHCKYDIIFNRFNNVPNNIGIVIPRTICTSSIIKKRLNRNMFKFSTQWWMSWLEIWSVLRLYLFNKLTLHFHGKLNMMCQQFVIGSGENYLNWVNMKILNFL